MGASLDTNAATIATLRAFVMKNAGYHYRKLVDQVAKEWPNRYTPMSEQELDERAEAAAAMDDYAYECGYSSDYGYDGCDDGFNSPFEAWLSQFDWRDARRIRAMDILEWLEKNSAKLIVSTGSFSSKQEAQSYEIGLGRRPGEFTIGGFTGNLHCGWTSLTERGLSFKSGYKTVFICLPEIVRSVGKEALDQFVEAIQASYRAKATANPSFQDSVDGDRMYYAQHNVGGLHHYLEYDSRIRLNDDHLCSLSAIKWENGILSVGSHNPTFFAPETVSVTVNSDDELDITLINTNGQHVQIRGADRYGRTIRMH